MADPISNMLSGASMHRAYKRSARQEVAAGAGGPIKWALQLYGPALDFLTDKNRKELIGYSLKGAGFDWGKVFLPKRFSHYVESPPFPYPRHRLGFYYHKARRMGIVKDILDRLPITKGWDPWKPDKPDFQLIVEWKKLNPNRYDKRLGLYGVAQTGLIFDMRKNAKSEVLKIIDTMWGDGKFVPLVESETARKAATGGFKVRPSVGSNKAMIKIPIPFGHVVNASVGVTVRTAPVWEVRWIADRFKKHMVARLANKGLSMEGGVVTTRTAPTVEQRASPAIAER